MSTLKGYPNKTKELRTPVHYPTVEPIRENQHGLSVAASVFVELIASDAVEAGSTTQLIVATSHEATIGDIIRLTSGALSPREVRVLSIPDDDTIELAETLPAVPATAVTFDILRPAHPRVDTLGATIASTALSFTLDGVSVDVTEDTVTPANNIPLPVKFLDELPAGDNNIGNVDIVSLPGTLEADIADIKTAIELLDDAVSGSELQVDVVGALPAGTNNIGDVDVASLPGTVEADISAIKTAVEILDNAIAGSEMQVDVLTLPAIPAGNNNIGDVDVASLPGTVEADIAAIKTAVETLDNAISGSEMQVDIVASLPAGNNNIGDVDIASALPAGDNNIGNVDVVTLPSIPAGNNNIGDVDVLSLPTVPGRSKVHLIRNDYSSVNVTTAAYVELVASTSAAINALDIFDSSGETLVLAVGAAASEVDQFYIVPGGNGKIELNIPSGSRIAVKAVSGNATGGELIINCFS